MLFTVISICVSLYEEGLFSFEPIHFLGLQLKLSPIFYAKKWHLRQPNHFWKINLLPLSVGCFHSFRWSSFIYQKKTNTPGEYTMNMPPQATVHLKTRHMFAISVFLFMHAYQMCSH